MHSPDLWETVVLPENGRVGDKIKDKDFLLFKVDSQDIWMKLKLDMNQKPNKRVETALDIKIEKQMLITQLNALL